MTKTEPTPEQVEERRRQVAVRDALEARGVPGDAPWWQACERVLADQRWRDPSDHPEPATPCVAQLDVGDNTGAGMDEAWAIVYWDGEVWIDVNGGHAWAGHGPPGHPTPSDLKPWMVGWRPLHPRAHHG